MYVVTWAKFLLLFRILRVAVLGILGIFNNNMLQFDNILSAFQLCASLTNYNKTNCN
jgi:hypothetical protein